MPGVWPRVLFIRYFVIKEASLIFNAQNQFQSQNGSNKRSDAEQLLQNNINYKVQPISTKEIEMTGCDTYKRCLTSETRSDLQKR